MTEVIEAKTGEIYAFDSPRCRIAVIMKNDTVCIFLRHGTPEFERVEATYSDSMKWEKPNDNS